MVAAGLATGQIGEFGPGALAALAYIGNWWMYTGHPTPLLEHTWTLAIEEHFYAVWPLLLLGWCSRRTWVRGVTAVASAACLIIVFNPWPEAIDAVRGTYLRGFPIVWGSLLAWADGRPWAPRWAGVAAWVGQVALVALVAGLLVPWRLPERWLTGPTSITGVLSLLVLAALVLAPTCRAAGALSWPPLRWAGTRSYGLYLYHFPILQVMRHQVGVGPEWARMALGIAVALLVTELSFRWLETPFLRLKGKWAPREVSSTGRLAADRG